LKWHTFVANTGA